MRVRNQLHLSLLLHSSSTSCSDAKSWTMQPVATLLKLTGSLNHRKLAEMMQSFVKLQDGSHLHIFQPRKAVRGRINASHPSSCCTDSCCTNPIRCKLCHSAICLYTCLPNDTTYSYDSSKPQLQARAKISLCPAQSTPKPTSVRVSSSERLRQGSAPSWSRLLTRNTPRGGKMKAAMSLMMSLQVTAMMPRFLHVPG